MVEQLQTDLDAVFGALSHSIRRRTLEVLGQGVRGASELAAPHAISLAAFMKHLRMLEQAGLITCTKEGRTLKCALVPKTLSPAAAWIVDRKSLWNQRLDALSRHLYQAEEVAPSRKRRR